MKTHTGTRLAGTRLSLSLLASVLLTISACSSDDDDNTLPAEDGSTTAGAPDNTSTDTGTGNDTGDNTDTDNEGAGTATDSPAAGISTFTIDATAGGFGAEPGDPANRWAYFNLITGMEVEIDDAQAQDYADWHVAFKRTNTKLNGGASGSGTVTGGIADAQLDFYDENDEPDEAAFTAATAEQELPALEAAIDPAQIDFQADADVAAIVSDGLSQGESWWLYDPSDNTLSADPDVWYAVRGADGDGYAKLHVTDIVQSEAQVSFELFIQAPAQSAFATDPVVWTAAVGPEGGALCYDFATTAEVDCDSSAAQWDLQLEITDRGRSWNLWTNSGVRGDGIEGGSFGPMNPQLQASIGSAGDVPRWFEDAPGGLFNEYDWYAYNLKGSHRIWPNYRVYAIDTGADAVYKLQVLSYYDEAGTSGVITFRYMEAD